MQIAKHMFWRHLFLASCLVVSLFWIISLEPIEQALSYHDFADNNTFLGIPNFLNVVSNLPFVIIGWLGLRYCNNPTSLCCSRPWQCFYIGVLLTGFGSAYYHWGPNSDTLVWDRLPMTVGFMSLFSALLAEKVHPCFARHGLYICLLLGVFSVLFWVVAKDLRLYYWVQFAPLLSLVVLLVVYPATYTHQSLLFTGLVCYCLAKVVEYYDQPIYQSLKVLSGHSLKHLLAGLAIYLIYVMLRTRKTKG